MRKIVLLALLFVLACGPAKAESGSVNDPVISIANLVASPPTNDTAKSNIALMKGMPAGLTMDGFGTFSNRGHVNDAIIGINSAAFKGAAIDLWVRGSLITKALPLILPAGGAVTLTGGSEFLRFFGAAGTVRKGAYFPVTFHFAHAPDMTVNMACASPSGKDDSGL